MSVFRMTGGRREGWVMTQGVNRRIIEPTPNAQFSFRELLQSFIMINGVNRIWFQNELHESDVVSVRYRVTRIPQDIDLGTVRVSGTTLTISVSGTSSSIAGSATRVVIDPIAILRDGSEFNLAVSNLPSDIMARNNSHRHLNINLVDDITIITDTISSVSAGEIRYSSFAVPSMLRNADDNGTWPVNQGTGVGRGRWRFLHPFNGNVVGTLPSGVSRISNGSRSMAMTAASDAIGNINRECEYSMTVHGITIDGVSKPVSMILQ